MGTYVGPWHEGNVPVPLDLNAHVREAVQLCQIADPDREFPCPAREAGGIQCERTDEHSIGDQHWVSLHTVTHALVGNGYTCASVDGRPE